MNARIFLLTAAFCLPSIHGYASPSQGQTEYMMNFTCSQDMLAMAHEEPSSIDRNAQFHLAYFYLHGICMEQDVSRGLYLMENAALQNHMKAAFSAAELYFHGRLVGADTDKAKRFYLIAAHQGHLVAQHRLGMILLKGSTSPEETGEGIAWLETAVHQGDGFSALVLAMIYERGLHGIERNHCMAQEWERTAIRLGSDFNKQPEATTSATAVSECRK